MQIPKLNADGKPLYLLPQPDLEVAYTVPVTVKTTDVTDHPVMVPQQVPLLDENGVQKTYEVTQPEPIIQTTTDADGNVTETITGYEQVGTGQWLPISLVTQIQEEGPNGPLYWGTVEEPATRFEPQPPLEITEDDPQYVEGLEPAYEEVPDPEPEPTPQPEPAPSLEQRIEKLEAIVLPEVSP